MRLKKKKLNKLNRSQKKRYILRRNFLFLKFGECGYYFKKENRLELVYFVYFRKLLKKLKFPQREEGHNFFCKKIWFFLKKNFPITKKSKNSRMGKGKGKFIRWTTRVARHQVFFEFYGYTFMSLEKICLKINKKNNLYIGFFKKFSPRVVVATNRCQSYELCTGYVSH